MSFRLLAGALGEDDPTGSIAMGKLLSILKRLE
jgi:hypothetical protein